MFAVFAIQFLGFLLFLLLEKLELGQPQGSRDFYFGPIMVFLSVGWTQLLYLPALAFYFHRKGKTEVRNGVLFVSAALFFATSLCYGTMMA